MDPRMMPIPRPLLSTIFRHGTGTKYIKKTQISWLSQITSKYTHTHPHQIISYQSESKSERIKIDMHESASKREVKLTGWQSIYQTEILCFLQTETSSAVVTTAL